MENLLFPMVRRMAAVLMTVLFAMPASAGLHATVALRPYAEVPGPHILLGDVAMLSSAALPDLQCLMSLPLGAAPRPGGRRMLGRVAIERAIAAGAGRRAWKLDWRGADRVTVETAAAVVTGEQLLSAARASLSGQDGARIPVDALRVPRDQTLPAGVVRLRARPFTPTGSARDRLVWIDIEVDGRFLRAVPVRFRHPLAPSSLALEWPSLNGPQHARSPAVSPPPDAVSRIDAQGVSRGEWATLRAARGAMSLALRVLVLDDGRPGQSVRVKPQGKATSLLAKVAAAHEVEMIE